jgi:hypothetical protein
MYPFYLGIDLHLKRTYVVLMDAKGERSECEALKTLNARRSGVRILRYRTKCPAGMPHLRRDRLR